MKSKIETHKSNQYYILRSFRSKQQWGDSYSLRLFQANNKLACFLKMWKESGFDWIEHELEDHYVQKQEKIIKNLTKGIDQDIKQLEFETEWDGYDSYSLRFLAVGPVDTFFDEAIKNTLAYLQFIFDEVNEWSIEDDDSDGNGGFTKDYRQMLNSLKGKKTTSDENRLENLKEIVEEIDNCLAENINQSI
jgi:hypothetical protein